MKDKPKTLTPRLRFPEFKNRPGWAEKSLGSQADFYKGRGVSKAEVDPSGTRPCIRYGELYTRYSEVIKDVFSRTNASDAGLFLSRKNDVIIPASGETKEDIATASCVMLDDVALGSDLNVIRTKHDGVFLSYLLNGKKRPDIAKVAQGDTVVHLYPSQLEQLPVAFPNLAEQRRIAACLTSLDEWIAAEGRKLDELRAHKKGLMQQLFPRDGEPCPRLRFPEFRNGPAWVTVPLGEIFETMSGGTPERTRKEYWGGTIPWITTSLVDFNVIREAEEFITEAGLENSSAKVLPKGTVLIAMYGQGKTRGKVAMLDIEATTNQACAAILPANGFDPVFTFLSLSGRYDEMRSLSNAGGQENLSQALIRELPFYYPDDPAEREKVAACLSSLDALIAAQTRKLDGLRAHKKGIMQQLFPSPEEV